MPKQAFVFGRDVFSPLSVDLDGPDLEVHADGGDVVPREGVVGEADEEGALADAGVADDEQLEQVVVVLVRTAQRHLERSRGVVRVLML